MERFKVAIVIPAFNEEGTIGHVVKSAIGYGTVIVVNDCSVDNTAIEAKKSGAIVINHRSNKGYECALNTGFIKSNELNVDAIITFDADGQHPRAYLEKYILELKNGIDLVLGVRPNTARLSEWFFKLYTKKRLNWHDPLCGMKGYHIKLYHDQGYFDSLKLVGTELALFGLKNDYSHVQISINILKREDKPRFSSYIKSNVSIFGALLKFRKLCNY